MSNSLRIFGALAFALAIVVSSPAGARVGATCGGFIIGSQQCGIGEFCQKPAGACWNFDVAGKCAVQPLRCFLRRGVFYIPECGCDGVTYANDCERRKAGVSMAHVGKC
jgi:hypothetical protein